MSFSPEIIAKTRAHFVEISKTSIALVKSGALKVNDPQKFVVDEMRDIMDMEAGLRDHSFAFRQMAHFFATGECIPLLSK